MAFRALATAWLFATLTTTEGRAAAVQAALEAAGTTGGLG